MAVCPNCGNQTGEGAVFCDQCGTRLPQPEAAAPAPAPAGGAVICPSCGAGNVPGEAFCDFCGSPLDAPEPTVEEPAPEQQPAVSEEPAAPGPVKEPAPAADPDQLTCPICGEAVLRDEAFCASCGASLAQAPIPPEPVDEAEAVDVPEPPEVAPKPAPEVAPEPVDEAEAVDVPEPPEVVPEPAPELEAAIEQAALPPTPAPEPLAEDAARTCPACGTEIEPGDAFCSTCGFALQAVTTPGAAPAQPDKPSAVGPRLVVSASGAEIPLPDKDEIIVGREDPVSGVYPEVDLTPHGGEEGGVSRRHARLVKENDKYYVEDLDSTNFTFVNKQKLAPKTRHVIDEGDEVRFGRVAVELRTG